MDGTESKDHEWGMRLNSAVEKLDAALISPGPRSADIEAVDRAAIFQRLERIEIALGLVDQPEAVRRMAHNEDSAVAMHKIECLIALLFCATPYPPELRG